MGFFRWFCWFFWSVFLGGFFWVGFLLPTLAAGQRPRHQQHPGRRRGRRLLDRRRRLLHAIRPCARGPRGGTAVDDGRRLAGPGGRPPSRPQPWHLKAGPSGRRHYAALECVGRVSRCLRKVRASQRSLLISVLRFGTLVQVGCHNIVPLGGAGLYGSLYRL